MNPLWTAALRSHWPLVGAFLVFLALAVSDQIWFRPTASRYRVAVKHASELGLAVDPSTMPPVLPPRLFALLSDNSLPAAAAQEQGNSGALTAQLLEELTDLTSRHGMRVIATEPGPVSQQPQAVQVRAHVRLRCRYADFLALLEDIARGGRLISIDRLTITSDLADSEVLELWVSRYIIKQEKAGR